jgi:hypothetical protein
MAAKFGRQIPVSLITRPPDRVYLESRLSRDLEADRLRRAIRFAPLYQPWRQ